MSLADKTVRGSAWIIATSIGARIIGVVGTLVLTRFLAPDAYGEVQAASVVVATASQLSTVGMGQYVIAHPDADRSVAFHATFYHLLLGALALGALLVARPYVGHLVGSEGIGPFLPGLVVSVMLDRLAFMPERVMVRDMRFRQLGIARTASEIAYTVASLAGAVSGWGGFAIVAGNIARSVVRLGMMVGASTLRDWLSFSPIRWNTSRTLFAFGLPLSVGASASYASRRWDNLVVSALFGPAVLGAYNLAYNLADVPAVQVGEQISDVLLPSFARIEEERRIPALVRSLSLLSLIMAPLAIGLGAVANTLVRALFDARWASVGPMLAVLSALSVTRPVGAVIWSYLQSRGRPRAVMALECLKLVLLLGSLILLGRLGPLWACGAVGLAFFVHTWLSLWVVHRAEPLPVGKLLRGLIAPVIATIPMVAAVLAVRAGHVALGVPPALGVLLEVVVGGIAYVPSAYLLAPAVTRDVVSLAMGLIRKRSGGKTVAAAQP